MFLKGTVKGESVDNTTERGGKRVRGGHEEDPSEGGDALHHRSRDALRRVGKDSCAAQCHSGEGQGLRYSDDGVRQILSPLQKVWITSSSFERTTMSASFPFERALRSAMFMRRAGVSEAMRIASVSGMPAFVPSCARRRPSWRCCLPVRSGRPVADAVFDDDLRTVGLSGIFLGVESRIGHAVGHE